MSRILSAALVISQIAACSEDPPSAPGVYTLSGPVVLTGYLVGANGQFTGTRVVGDADGVGVELLYGTQVVARTTTVDGVYSFRGLAPGGYKVRAPVIGDIGDETLPLTITSYDLVSGDTLRLVSRGDLYPVPNPFGQSTTIYFSLRDSLKVDVRILDLGGITMRTLLNAQRPAGLNQVRWEANDQAGRPVTGTIYWVTLEALDGERAQLLFR